MGVRVSPRAQEARLKQWFQKRRKTQKVCLDFFPTSSIFNLVFRELTPCNLSVWLAINPTQLWWNKTTLNLTGHGGASLALPLGHLWHLCLK